MTIKYYGTPITPKLLMYEEMAGAHFCVSFWAPAQIRLCHELGQSVMLDHGAYSAWKQQKPIKDWRPFYAWADQWLDYPTTWAVIPDIIEGDEDANRRLVDQWPHRGQGAPVWHMHESFHRLLGLIHTFPRVCIGSSGAFAEVMAEPWQRRMDAAWREIDKVFKRTPTIHMMRGMQLIGQRWPFASVDSTDVARNHNRKENTPTKMRWRWDAGQCPPRFIDPGEQLRLEAA